MIWMFPVPWATTTYVQNDPVNWVEPWGLAGSYPYYPSWLDVGRADNDVIKGTSLGLKGAGTAISNAAGALGPDASGVAVNASWVNPFTSHGGGVVGLNKMFFPNGDVADYAYISSECKDTEGFDVGIAGESVWAWGDGDASSWEGPFDLRNLNIGPFALSVFWSPDLSWKGVTIGIGFGLPGAAKERTNYELIKKY